MDTPTLKSVQACLVEDDHYFEKAIALIQTTNHFCFASVFIIDHGFDMLTKTRVDALIFEMACARWRGVTTKLLIGGSRTNDSILIPSLAAKARAQELGINVKLVAATKQQSNHVKLLIADNTIITGSHNWSGALSGNQTQDSVLVESEALASYMKNYFEHQWAPINQNYYDVSL